MRLATSETVRVAVSDQTMDVRPTGLAAVGPVRWGTHLCQFYRTSDDLLDALVPYFKAGLEANERCLWITSPPLRAADVRRTLERAVRDLTERMERGQIEILDREDWHRRTGHPREEPLRGWIEYEAKALEL